MGSYKARRKQKRYTQFLKKELNIDSSEEPSQYLMVCNAGLVSGIQHEELAELFSQFGLIEKIVMKKGKSYSFVVFHEVSDASRAFQAVNGQIKLDRMDGPIYLLYSKTVPEDDSSNVAGESLSGNEPEGLSLLTDFVTADEEEMLLKCVRWDGEDQDSEKTMRHRQVKHFGYEFRYDTNDVDADAPLPDPVPGECDFITERLRDRGRPLPWTPDQLTVNRYRSGQGIPSHVDTHSAFESPLLSLSLGSAVVMELKSGGRTVPVLLPPRSLLILDGEARYAWRHGITPRGSDVVRVGGGLTARPRAERTSFTLRRVRRGACACRHPAQCDSQRANSPKVPETEAARMEQLHVHQVYERIAGHFSETRTKVWPDVGRFLATFPAGSVVVDAGCGNGKYFGVNADVFHEICELDSSADSNLSRFQLGFDRSAALVEITRGRGHEVFVSDCLSTSLRDGSADGVISVAVLHHLASAERRSRAVAEVGRILRSGGRALITVWAMDQSRERTMSAYLKQDRKNRRNGMPEASQPADDAEPVPTSGDVRLPVHTQRTPFAHRDLLVPWKTRAGAAPGASEVHLRYYHLFEENELANLCAQVAGVRVAHNYYSEGNWIVILEKVT